MAPVANTFMTYQSTGNREDLLDAIYNISPTATPVLSNAGRGSAKAVRHDWQTDSLAAAATNAHVQGDETSFNAVTASTLQANYMQIAKKAVVISGTQQAIDKAGRESEVNYQLAKISKEIKRDMEVDLTANNAAVAPAAGVAGELGGLPAWIRTNTSFGATGADPAAANPTPGAARTDGTQRAFTLTLLQEVIRECFASGAEPTTLLVGPFNKQAVSAFTGISSVQYNLSKPEAAAVIAAVDVIKNDFGLLFVVPDRFSRERDAFVIDWNMLSVDYLRPFMEEKLNKSGDAEKWHLLCEYTLRVNNQAGLGIVADLTTS